MGRPKFLIDDAMIKKVKEWGARGLNQEQIALSMGIDPATLLRHKKHNAVFAAAIKEGQARGVADVTNALYKSAKRGNLGAQIFYLKNRGGWSDRQELEVKTQVTEIKRVIVDITD